MNKNNNTTASTLIRVTNAVTPYMAGQLTKEQWDEYEEDLIEGLSQFGTILHHWFVTKDEKEVCADPGNLFIEYESKKEAEKAMEEMQGRIYDERTISLYFVPRDLYYQNFKKNLTPPVLKDKN
jgi:RNA recognition motif-containing protein